MNQMESQHDIHIRDLSVMFDTALGQVRAVQDVSSSFPFGEITGMIGESGSGKSVMAMSILKLLGESAKIQGECWYGDQDLYALKETELQRLRGREFGLIPQNPTASINPMIKIKKQLMEPLCLHGLANKREAQERVYQLLQEFGFDNPRAIGEKYAFEMSGGMNQRVISALGLICNPPWIIADEPTKGLDSILRNQVYQVLKRIHCERGCGMLVITHDLLLAQKLCHGLRVTYGGQMVEQGGCAQIFQNPLHPYTQGLLGALPQNGMKPMALAQEGQDVGKSSCVFYPRCPKATPCCINRPMEDFPVEDGRKVRCFLYACV